MDETAQGEQAKLSRDPWLEAAMLQGLVQRDEEYETALEEALAAGMDAGRLFAYMLHHGEMHQPARLWHKFKSQLANEHPSTRAIPATLHRRGIISAGPLAAPRSLSESTTRGWTHPVMA